MRIIRRSETIRELPDGRWLNKHTGRYHKSAIQAQEAVSRRAKDIAHQTPKAAVVTILRWEPITRVGTIVIKAITSVK